MTYSTFREHLDHHLCQHLLARKLIEDITFDILQIIQWSSSFPPHPPSKIFSPPFFVFDLFSPHGRFYPPVSFK